VTKLAGWVLLAGGAAALAGYGGYYAVLELFSDHIP
jgi:hypothetical protein